MESAIMLRCPYSGAVQRTSSSGTRMGGTRYTRAHGASSENFIYALAPRVEQHQMHFLDTCGLRARYCDDKIGCRVDESRGAGEGDRDVAWARQSLDLTLEQRGIPEVVRDARHRARVAHQRDGRQGAAILEESADQLTGEMTRLGGAATIPERDDFVALVKRLDEDALNGAGDIVQLDDALSHHLLMRREVVRERGS